MKFAILSLSLVLGFGVSASAGTAMMVKNEALGFSLIQYPQGDVDTEFCDGSNKCITFERTGEAGPNTGSYRATSGECELTIETFDKSFRTGNTKNEFMLDLMVFVVKVTKGEDKCQLKSAIGQRSLTGIYE